MARGCYVDLYHDANFKGVDFDAMEVTSEHGRRGAEGEFPFGENTGYVDLGRRIRKYSLRARFVENSHIADSERLIAACESIGPGLLTHPTRGIVQVACYSCKVTDNPLEEQGVTYIDMEFVEAAEFLAGANFVGGLLSGIDSGSFLAVVSTAFDSVFNPSLAFTFRISDIMASTTSVIASIRNEFSNAIGTSTDENKLQILAEFNTVLTDTTRLTDFEVVRNTIINGASAVSENLSTSERFAAFRRISNVAAASPSSSSVQVEKQENALFALARATAVANMAQASVETTQNNLADALIEADIISAVFAQEIEQARNTCEDYLHVAFRRFASETEVALLNRAYNLPALVEYDFGTGVHSLVAAWEIYGDAKQAVSLERQNPQYSVFNLGPKIVATRK